MFGGYVALTKPRIIELLLITTVPTMVLAEEGWPAWGLVLVTLLGGSLAAGGANAINMVVDRDIDRLMERTKNRPLVTGLVSVRGAMVFALSLEVAAFGVLWWGANLLSAVLALSATLFYVFVYTLWLKRTSRQNIVIGGAAGAVPVLVGWSAVRDSLDWAPIVLFLAIFLWTPPHFWALAIRHADDYRAASVPMLPSVVPMRQTIRQMTIYTVILTLVTVLLAPVADLGPIYLVSAILLGGAFVIGTVVLGRSAADSGPDSGSDSAPDSAPDSGPDSGANSASMRLFGFSISYVTLLFVALAVDVLVRHGV